VGDAGVLLDPMDLDGLCQALLDLCEKPTSREALSRKGIERARQFSWERFRDQTIEGYRLALRN
jgi:glycosyltransferase involved in cell wall biosynthesis